jgi:hypothetical protein
MSPTPVKLNDDELLKQRRRRNSIALGLILGALVIIFYVLTIAKMGPALFTTRDL